MRKVILVLAVILPQPLKQFLYRTLLKWKIGRGVKIGYSYLDAVSVELGDGVQIGHFNVVRGVRRFSVGAGTYIANFNEFFGDGGFYKDFASRLEIGRDVRLMSHHFIDVGGVVTIGDRTTVGGRDTHFWSHTRTLYSGVPKLEPTTVTIGADVYIGARATFVGCSIPDGAVVGAGSIVSKHFAPEDQRLLIAGNPATIKKRYDAAPAEPGINAANEDGVERR